MGSVVLGFEEPGSVGRVVLDVGSCVRAKGSNCDTNYSVCEIAIGGSESTYDQQCQQRESHRTAQGEIGEGLKIEG